MNVRLDERSMQLFDWATLRKYAWENIYNLRLGVQNRAK
jgi:hypothetical protein